MTPSTASLEHNETMKLTDLILYLSTGVNHPAGISFDCKIDFFNHNAGISATVAEQIDPFALGPLTVTVAIELSPNPALSFVAKIAFAESLEFYLKATMVGSFSGAKSQDLDFSLEAPEDRPAYHCRSPGILQCDA